MRGAGQRRHDADREQVVLGPAVVAELEAWMPARAGTCAPESGMRCVPEKDCWPATAASGIHAYWSRTHD